MKFVTIALAALALSATSATAEMSLSFKGWGNIPLCTSGNPNKVGNPEFVLKGVPANTDKLVFKLTDLDVRSYNHGGGTVKIKQGGNMKIPSGLFKYKSPCPPSGKHTYEWSVTAKDGSKTLAKAKAAKQYP